MYKEDLYTSIYSRDAKTSRILTPIKPKCGLNFKIKSFDNKNENRIEIRRGKLEDVNVYKRDR